MRRYLHLDNRRDYKCLCQVGIQTRIITANTLLAEKEAMNLCLATINNKVKDTQNF